VLFRLPLPAVRPADPFDAPLAWLGRAALDAAVLSYVAWHARWTGWRLAGALFALFYGITALSLLDAAVFVPEVVSGAVFVEAAIVAGLFGPLVVVAQGRWAASGSLEAGSPAAAADAWPRARSSWGWAWRLALLAVVYVALYIAFGLLVFTPLARALAPAVLETYAARDVPPWILPFQALRGLLFVLVALPVLRATTGGRRQAGLSLGLAYGGLMAADLLIPTGLIPPAMQAAHFVEVFAENCLFGWLVALTLAAPGSRPAGAAG
jgi:hypothetical protein